MKAASDTAANPQEAGFAVARGHSTGKPCRRAACARRRVRAFTLAELGLALLVLGLGGYFALAAVRKIQHRAGLDRFAAELRGLAEAFETHRVQWGDWPAATDAERRTPRGMESALAKTTWLAGSPIGGSYDWTPPTRIDPTQKEPKKRAPSPGLITVTAFSPAAALPLTEADLLYVDRVLDDGDLTTGRFRTGFNGWPTYAVNSAR